VIGKTVDEPSIEIWPLNVLAAAIGMEGASDMLLPVVGWAGAAVVGCGAADGAAAGAQATAMVSVSTTNMTAKSVLRLNIPTFPPKKITLIRAVLWSHFRAPVLTIVQGNANAL
jgi:hypothetical protein